jgi:hypothetical protein
LGLHEVTECSISRIDGAPYEEPTGMPRYIVSPLDFKDTGEFEDIQLIDFSSGKFSFVF